MRSAHVLALLFLSGVATGALAQTPPQPLAMPPEIAAPKDVAYRGTLKLSVDATDLERHIFRVHETIPVQAGPVTLLYPQWLPGYHAPVGRIDQLAGLVIKAGGTRLEWTRDIVDGYALRVTVPKGATALDIEFQCLTPVEPAQGRVVMTQEMMDVQWQGVALYPAGYFTRQIQIEASVKLPEGWQYATALQTASAAGGTVTFKPVSFNVLVDSPMYAGKYAAKLDLDPGAAIPVHLNVFADRPDLLDYKPEHLEAHRNLVRQAYKLYGRPQYDHYDFLLSLSNQMGGIGLEHHRSSENGTLQAFFTDWDKNPDTRELLPHEYTHSWNGKFRRPLDLFTPTFNMPMRDTLLWVYEGQTQYWGYVLAARSGLVTKQQALDAIAATAALYDNRRGREWRPLQDTTNDPVLANRRPLPWRSWQRSEDYYSEGELVWLDADTSIREMSGEKKSLDDFARAFFGIDNGGFITATYGFDDVAKTLNSVQASDWGKFLRARLDNVTTNAPLDGIARGGYKLVYTETPSDVWKAGEQRRRTIDMTYSLGFTVGQEARLTDVLWEGPGFDAGLTVGTQIVAINGVAYEGDRFREIVKASKESKEPIAFMVKNGDRYRSVTIDYHGGLRYPHLERDESKPARLDAILAAKN